MEPSKYYIHPSSVLHESATVGNETKIWHFCHIMQDSVIGSYCSLGQNVVVSPNVRLGNFVKVQNNVSIYSGVKCEDYVFLGPSMVFTNVINPRSALNRRNEFKSTFVRHGATIGANATILCGIEIGRFALIGAGTVVTKSVAPHALIVGNPGRQVGWVSEYGHTLELDKEGRATCPESKQQYILEHNILVKITE